MIAVSMTSLISKIDHLDFTVQEKKKEEPTTSSSLQDSGCDLEHSPHTSHNYDEQEIIPEEKAAAMLKFGSGFDFDSMSSVDSCAQSETDNHYVTIDKAFCIHKAEIDKVQFKYCDPVDSVAGTNTSQCVCGNAQGTCTCIAESDSMKNFSQEGDPESGVWLTLDSHSSSGICRT